MEHQETDLSLLRHQKTLDSCCFVRAHTQPKMEERAPNGVHPEKIEKCSFELFLPVRGAIAMSNEILATRLASTASHSRSVTGRCDANIVKVSLEIHKNPCAIGPTHGFKKVSSRTSDLLPEQTRAMPAGTLKIAVTWMRRIRASIVRLALLTFSLSILAACSAVPRENAAQDLRARQCVSTVLLCDDCRY